MRVSILIGLVLLALSGCSVPTGGKSNDRIRTIDLKTNTSNQPCEIAADVGEAAVEVKQNVVSIQLEGKLLDISKVESLLAASGVETMKTISTSGVELYKTSVDENALCRYAQSLPNAPARAQKRWNDNEDSLAGQGTILGLFMPDALDVPIILVREETTKWTLVHEYMHYLFYAQRTRDGHSLTDAQLFNLMDDYLNAKNRNKNEFRKNPSEKSLAQLITVTIGYVESRITYLNYFDLEEIAIEGYLLKKHKSGELKQVSSEDASRARTYLNYIYNDNRNRNNVSAQIDDLLNEIANLEQEAKGLQVSENLSAKMAALKERVSQLQQQIKEFVRNI